MLRPLFDVGKWMFDAAIDLFGQRQRFSSRAWARLHVSGERARIVFADLRSTASHKSSIQKPNMP
jgi:hypothetical protein